MSITQERFIALMNEHNMTYRDLAEKTGISRSTLQRMATVEDTKIDLKYIQRLAKAFNVEPSYLCGWTDEKYGTSENSKYEYIDIPVYNAISCDDEPTIIEYVNVPDRMLDRTLAYFALFADDDSMINENINKGDLMIFNKTSHLENNDIGCFCVDDSGTFNKYHKDDKNDCVWLLPANDEYSPINVPKNTKSFNILGKLTLVLSDRRK
jgi:repressor LexA